MGKSFVYLVTGPSGKQYVGITSRSVAWRWKKHTYAAACAPKGALQFAISKHGSGAFRVEQICVCESVDEARDREKHYVRELGTMAPNGYNLSAGGESGPPGVNRSEETRAKLSLAWSTLSDAERSARAEKISAANARRTPEEIARISEAISASKRGKKRPAEVVAKVSASRSGQKKTPEQIEKTASANRGRKHSAEFCARMSEIAKDRVSQDPSVMIRLRLTRSPIMSDETRAKMSEAAQARREQTAETMREIWRKRKEGDAA